MQEELILKIANLMTEQSAAFTSLESVTNQLIGALVRCDALSIESLSRAGETELRRMRSRLLEITTSLSNFSELNRQENSPKKIGAEVREQFETAANTLIAAAQNYQKINNRSANLALSGSSFATACIQICGVPPTTYRAPVLKTSTGGQIR
jgi:hypothetical protein